MQRPHGRIWDFADLCQRAATAEEVGAAFRNEVRQLGFVHLALCTHVDPQNPPPGAVSFLDYPPEWVAHYMEEQYVRFDPVPAEAGRRGAPFFWTDADFLAKLSAEQRRLLDEGGQVGLAGGYTIPLHGPGALPASCTLIPGKDGVDETSYLLAHSMAVYAYEGARRLLSPLAFADGPRLTKRERECLTLAARGKSDWSISEILGISERTAHHTIERAKVRLGVATRVQAIVRALISGEISADDTFC